MNALRDLWTGRAGLLLGIAAENGGKASVQAFLFDALPEPLRKAPQGGRWRHD
jgi:hypothetical protein